MRWAGGEHVRVGFLVFLAGGIANRKFSVSRQAGRTKCAYGVLFIESKRWKSQLSHVSVKDITIPDDSRP